MLKESLKKFLLIILVMTALAFCSNACFADTPIQTQLSKIENEIWGFDYHDESDAVRIERVEKQVFGVANPKLTPEKRVDKITKSLGLETYEEARSSLSDLYVMEQAGAGAEYPQIDQLEGAILGSVYKDENIYKRLERLEKKVFGAKQEGELAQRTEALKKHSLATTSTNNAPFYTQKDSNNYGYNTEGEDVKLQLAALENMIFATDFSQEPVPLRLNRLENKIFQRNFLDDEIQTRVSRIQAAATANKTAKYYDSNKFQKFAATGLQAASFLLMILAFIL